MAIKKFIKIVLRLIVIKFRYAGNKLYCQLYWQYNLIATYRRFILTIPETVLERLYVQLPVIKLKNLFFRILLNKCD